MPQEQPLGPAETPDEVTSGGDTGPPRRRRGCAQSRCLCSGPTAGGEDAPRPGTAGVAEAELRLTGDARPGGGCRAPLETRLGGPRVWGCLSSLLHSGGRGRRVSPEPRMEAGADLGRGRLQKVLMRPSAALELRVRPSSSGSWPQRACAPVRCNPSRVVRGPEQPGGSGWKRYSWRLADGGGSPGGPSSSCHKNWVKFTSLPCPLPAPPSPYNKSPPQLPPTPPAWQWLTHFAHLWICLSPTFPSSRTPRPALPSLGTRSTTEDSSEVCSFSGMHNIPVPG